MKPIRRFDHLSCIAALVLGVSTLAVTGRRAGAEEYLGQMPPGATPVVFAPGIVSTEAGNEHSAPSFSPDGNEVFWFLNQWPDEGPNSSMMMRRENGRWSAPRVTPFAGLMPAFSPDGRRVYFYAFTPGPALSQGGQSHLDIWVVEKQGDTWSEPRCVDLVTRYPELRTAIQPTLTRNGTLYFMGYAPGPRNAGIYRAELINGEYAKPELLAPSINLQPFINWAPFIAPDESYLLFSSNRTGSLDRWGDLYVSHRLPDGSWTEPVSLGEPINTPRQEVFPGLSPDGKFLFFCRHTPGRKNDVYWVSAASIPALRPLTDAPREKTSARLPTRGTVTDIDGNVYKTVTIGTQVWMAEDLRTTRYRNGDPIGTTNPATLDIRSESAPKYQWAYAGDEKNVATYGRLYTWYAATDSRAIAPAGWHVPTDAEWTTLAEFLGGENAVQGQLKEVGTTHWNAPNAGATNASGFTALPGGNRWDTGRFLGLGDFTHWWTASESEGESAWRRMLSKDGPVGNFRGSSGKKVGWLVRCVRDAPPDAESGPAPATNLSRTP